MQRLSQDIRTQLRNERIPYLGSVVDGQTVRVTLRAGADVAAASKLIQGSDPGMTITNESVGDQVVLTVAFTPQRLKERQGLAIEQNITTLRNRVNELGVSEPIVNRQGVDRIVVQLPGVQDPNQAVRVLGATATVEFRLVDEANNPYEAESSKRVPIGSKLYKETDGRPILLKRDVIATGEQLTDATSRFSEGAPEVGVTLDARGGQEMLEATRDNVGRRMAVVYIETKSLAEGEVCKGARSGDVCTEERVINAATIQSVLSSSFRITGLQSAEAHELALLLRSGALAAPQRIVEQRSIGPSLGKDNIVRGLRGTGRRRSADVHLPRGLLQLVRDGGERHSADQRGAAGRIDVGAAWSRAVAAGHCRRRAHDRHGRGRQRADLRTNPRGIAQRQLAARRDRRGLRQSVFGDRGFERHDADRRYRAVRVRHRSDQGLCRDPRAGHLYLAVHGGCRAAAC